MANKGWVPAASDEAKGRARGDQIRVVVVVVQ